MATETINAPLEAVWDTLTDVPTYASFLGNVQKIELLCRKGGKLKEIAEEDFEFKEGGVWRETALFDGQTYVTVESVTSIKELKDENGMVISRTYSGHAAFTKNIVHEKTAHTATYTVIRKSEKTCQIKASMAFFASGCFGVLDVWRRGQGVQVWAEGMFQGHLNEYAAEAERRYQSSDKAKIGQAS